jgi:hypothetical protein
MSRAIEHIVGGYVRLKDRAALQQMRDQRNRLLQESRLRAAQGFKVECLDAALQDEVVALDEALAQL